MLASPPDQRVDPNDPLDHGRLRELGGLHRSWTQQEWEDVVGPKMAEANTTVSVLSGVTSVVNGYWSDVWWLKPLVPTSLPRQLKRKERTQFLPDQSTILDEEAARYHNASTRSEKATIVQEILVDPIFSVLYLDKLQVQGLLQDRYRRIKVKTARRQEEPRVESEEVQLDDGWEDAVQGSTVAGSVGGSDETKII